MTNLTEHKAIQIYYKRKSTTSRPVLHDAYSKLMLLSSDCDDKYRMMASLIKRELDDRMSHVRAILEQRSMLITAHAGGFNTIHRR